jgi:hypothetical protein
MRRTTRQVALAEAAQGAFRVLPPFLTAAILALVPADSRCQAACVCRSWRDALADGALWQHLDLSAAGGVEAPVTAAALAACLARLGRRPLLCLDLTDCADVPEFSLLDTAHRHRESLRVLRLCGAGEAARQNRNFGFTHLTLLSEFMHGFELRELHVGVDCSAAEARVALRRGEGQRTGAILPPDFFASTLRVHSLGVHLEENDDVPALLRDAAACPSLQELNLVGVRLQDAAPVEALADAACSLPLRVVQLMHDGPPEEGAALSPALAPALTRMLRNGALRELRLDAAGMRLQLPRELCEAFGACTTLRTLVLDAVRLWALLARDGAALLQALQGHPTLRELNLRGNEPDSLGSAAAAGRALGALLAADGPLERLSVVACFLGEPGLQPLCAGLERNRHLQSLEMMGNGLTQHVARHRLLPAVRACSSLHRLQTGEFIFAAHQAEMEVRGRTNPEMARGGRVAQRG